MIGSDKFVVKRYLSDPSEEKTLAFAAVYGASSSESILSRTFMNMGFYPCLDDKGRQLPYSEHC
jgi:hypothetical protein